MESGTPEKAEAKALLENGEDAQPEKKDPKLTRAQLAPQVLGPSTNTPFQAGILRKNSLGKRSLSSVIALRLPSNLMDFISTGLEKVEVPDQWEEKPQSTSGKAGIQESTGR